MATKALATLLAVSTVYYASFLWKAWVNYWNLRSIPTMGSSGFLTSFIGASWCLKHAQEIGQEGYNKYRGSFFKLPTMSQWMIMVSSPRHIEEIRNASDEYLSFHEALIDILRMDVTVGPEVYKPFHINVVRTTLTNNIRTKFGDVRDEIATAFADYIPTANEWYSVIVLSTMMDIVCRTSNRVFVGLPLCRDPDFMFLNKEFTVNIMNAFYTISKFPIFLRSVVSRFTNVFDDIERGMRHLEPLIKERLEQEAQFGKDWPGRPNDLLSWLLDAAQGEQRSIRGMTLGVLFVNLAAIHTASISMTYILYDLAAHPEYVQPMRDEIELALQEGWSYTAISKLSKVDSFIKESLRLSTIDTYGLKRKVMKDYTFSDDTTTPAGNLIGVPMLAIHLDPEIYDNPTSFDGFRFERMRQEKGENAKHKFLSLDPDYLIFGQGRQACAGRFFAANVLKTMLVHVLLNYDIKMPDGVGRPKNISIGSVIVPDPTAKVLFRKRI